MDKDEGERLAKAIARTRVAWLEVRGIERNPITGEYELNCLYRHEKGLAPWTELRIRSPRQWIDLLTSRGAI